MADASAKTGPPGPGRRKGACFDSFRNSAILMNRNMSFFLNSHLEKRLFMEQYTFDAFISYSHKDLSFGKWLQRKLETFSIPADMRGERPKGQKLRIFRDQTDLAGTGLQDSLRANLREARYLIVLCSPQSAASSWVNEEVLFFISLGRKERIIPFIIDGEPMSDDPGLECYPEGLRSIRDYTLLGASIQEIGRNKAFLKLVSILLGVRFGRLVDREKQRRRRTILSTLAAALVLLVTGGSLLWRNAVISRQNKKLNYDIYGAALVSISQKDVIEPGDVEFLTASAKEDNTQAILFLADCLKNGWGTEQDLEAAYTWSRRGADLGNPECMIFLSNCYQNGEGTGQDLEQAFLWSMKAAQAGNSSGMLNVAISYEEGLGVEADPEEAFAWYTKSAEAGNDLGMYNLANCYRAGIGTDPDPQMAFAWMEKVAQTGNPTAMYNMGLMYQNGYGTGEDPENAYLWFKKAADAGDADGAYMAGYCWENGYGVTDPALEWYTIGAQRGSDRAREALQRWSNEAD